MDKLILDKLDTIFNDFPKTNTCNINLLDFEELILPETYIFILKHYSNIYIKENYGYVSKEKNRYTINKGFDICNYFFSKEEMFEKQMKYKEELGESVIPIGEKNGGNLLCLDIISGAVYNWIHDADEKNLFLVNEDFDQFILSFDKFDPVKFEKEEIVKGFSKSKLNNMISQYKNVNKDS